MKNIIIILFILLFLFIIYKCSCYKNNTENFTNRYSKNTVIDLIKGVDVNGNRRENISDDVKIEKKNLIYEYGDYYIFEPTLGKDEYILGSMVDITFPNPTYTNNKNHYPHILNYVYEKSDDNEIDKLKNLKTHDDTNKIILTIQDNITSDNNYDNFKTYLDNKFSGSTDLTYHDYITNKNPPLFSLEELLGFKEPNIRNINQMNKYVKDKYYNFDHNLEMTRTTSIKSLIEHLIGTAKIDRLTTIIPGIENINGSKMPYLTESSLYKFLNLNQIIYKGSIKKLNLLTKDKLDTKLKALENFQFYIYYFEVDINHPTMNTKKLVLDEITKENFSAEIDDFDNIIKKQTDYLFQNQTVQDIQKKFPNYVQEKDNNYNYNLYYHSFQNNKNFKYLGGILSHDKILSDEDKKKILKIPIRCLNESTDTYIWFNQKKSLAIHPIYKTIIKVNTIQDKPWELKPCVELQTTFKEKINDYKKIKNKCSKYSKSNIENPIFNKVSDTVHNQINEKKLLANRKILKEKRELLKKLKREDVIKNNINRTYNRSRLNKYLNNKEEDLYILNKKLRKNKNAFDLNLYYSDGLNDCLGEIKKIDKTLNETDKKKKIANILASCKYSIGEKAKAQEAAEAEKQKEIILKKCTQPGIIRKDAIPCWGCKTIVNN